MRLQLRAGDKQTEQKVYVVKDFSIPLLGLMKMSVPTNVGELRSFLGMVNQLRKFISHLAENDRALHDHLSKKNVWICDVDQAAAFKNLLQCWLCMILIRAQKCQLTRHHMVWEGFFSRGGRTNGNPWHTHRGHLLQPNNSMHKLRRRPLASHGPANGFVTFS